VWGGHSCPRASYILLRLMYLRNLCSTRCESSLSISRIVVETSVKRITQFSNHKGHEGSRRNVLRVSVSLGAAINFPVIAY
jgi:hypothetical protein